MALTIFFITLTWNYNYMIGKVTYIGNSPTITISTNLCRRYSIAYVLLFPVLPKLSKSLSPSPCTAHTDCSSLCASKSCGTALRRSSPSDRTWPTTSWGPSWWPPVCYWPSPSPPLDRSWASLALSASQSSDWLRLPSSKLSPTGTSASDQENTLSGRTY